jgi:peroxiredoxin
MKIIHTIFIVLFLVALVAGQNVGDPAPDFTLQTLEHGEVSLSSLAGKVVYLNFIGYN